MTVGLWAGLLQEKSPLLFSVLANIYFNIKRNHAKFVLIPRSNCWLLKWKHSTLHIPYPSRISAFPNGLQPRLNSVVQKYSLPNIVEVEKGDLVCDVGAYIGEFSLAIAHKARKILAFEPDPLAVISLRKNLEHLKNVDIYEKLLWKYNTILEFNIASATADSSVFNTDSGICERKIRMRAQPLDKLLFNVDKIDFLKIDAEGAEPEVLLGATKVLHRTSKIAVDCTPERFGKPTSKRVQKILVSSNFQTVVSNRHIVYAWK